MYRVMIKGISVEVNSLERALKVSRKLESMGEQSKVYWEPNATKEED